MAGENADLKLDEDGEDDSAKEGISPVDKPEDETSPSGDLDDADAAVAAQKLEQLSLAQTNGVEPSTVQSSQPTVRLQSENENVEPTSTAMPFPATETAAGLEDGGKTTGEQSSETPPTEASEMSKKAKRRAREAAKKAKEAENLNDAANQVRSSRDQPTYLEHQLTCYWICAVDKTCNVCAESFTSRTKLFDHIKDTGHALTSPVRGQNGGDMSKQTTSNQSGVGSRNQKRKGKKGR